jgi:S-DNA-T family DNA segregation ATPase FtsK/SpoIIIE
VIIVDELADLMMTVQGEVEPRSRMLAQKAAPSGIHLILAHATAPR